MPRPRRLTAVLNHLILLAGSAFLLAPVAAVLLSSTHSTATLVRDGLQLSLGDQLIQNYGTVLSLEAGFGGGVTAPVMLKNSLIVGLGVGTFTTVLSLLTAYAIVFFRFRWSALTFWLVFITLLFPLESRVIPTFAITSDLGLINTHAGIILPVLASAIGTFFFRQYFLTIPDEMVEAAILDRVGPVRFLVDFVVPLSWSRSGAIFVIAFMLGWNQYLWPLMISTDESLYTLVRGVQLIGLGSAPGMALVVISIVPPLVMLILFQRWLYRALSSTA